MEVAAEIKKYLKERGISQAFISKRTGISRPKLTMALNGTRRLTLPEYAAICWALGVNTDMFLKPCPLDAV